MDNQVMAFLALYLTGLLIVSIIFYFNTAAERRHKKLLSYLYDNFKNIDPNSRPPSKRELKPEIKTRKVVNSAHERKLERFRSGKQIDPYD